MPVECQTGLPGEGKTLVTLDRLIKEYDQDLKKNKDDPDHIIRPVYYYNVDLSEYGREKLKDWHPLTEEQVKLWYELPIGSKILIDECQTIFRPLPQGKEKPLYYTKLETHRHRGYDLFLITQSIKLIDMSVRELVTYHGYIERRFNTSQCTLWVGKRWQAETALKKDPRADQRPYKHNKKVFEYYSSAQMHTIKTKIPLKLKILIPLVILTLAFGYTAFQRGVSGFSEGEEIADDIPQDKNKTLPDGVKKLTEFNHEPDTLIDGLMKGRKIFITGTGSYGTYFNVNGQTLMSYDLKAIGYKIVVRNECFAIVNRTPVTCAPPDYWGEEYHPYQEKRKDDKKKRPKKPIKKTEDKDTKQT